MTLDLSTSKRIHIVGVGGAGMSAIATVLHWMGHSVSGSDLKASTGLDRLRALGITVSVGHAAENIDGAQLVAISTAIPASNAEVTAATAAGVPVVRRAEILTAITKLRRTVAVGGTHGKTTTSSMLALMLVHAGLSPSFIIGGDVNEIGSGAVWGDGELFVVEADESDGTFLELHREGSIITNVEPDHLDFYGGEKELRQAFERFVRETNGPCVVCADDDGSAALAALDNVMTTTYGTTATADYRMVDLRRDGTGTAFSLEHDGSVIGSLRLPVPGLHNARNVTAAAVMAIELGASFDLIAEAVARYAGVARRFEFRGEANGVTFVDDYAHLPTEVEAALEAADTGEWKRIVCVFQPHRYSRTAELWEAFADSFGVADHLVVTDVYAAGETPRPGISGKLIADAVLDRHPWRDLAYVPRRTSLVSYLTASLRPGDLCLTLGAGDLTTLPDELQQVS